MKPFELSKTSWHYKIATKWGGLRDLSNFRGEAYPIDFCHYLRCVAWALVKGLFIAILAAIVAYGLWDTILWAYQSFVLGHFITLKGRIAGLVLYFGGLFLVIASLVGVMYFFTMRATNRSFAPKEPGFLKLAYRSFKDKTCVQVVLKD